MIKTFLLILIYSHLLLGNIIEIKKGFIEKVNNLLPEYLYIKNTSTFNLSIYKDISKPILVNMGANIRLFYFDVINNKYKVTKGIKRKYNLFSYRFSPYFRLEELKLKFILDNLIIIKINNISLGFNFKFYPFNLYWSEKNSIKYKYKKFVSKIDYSTNRSEFQSFNHTFSIYYIFSNNIIIGEEIKGSNKNYPYFYSYKSFINYHKKLIRNFFIDIIPYILNSKKNHFNTKVSILTGFKYKF